MDLNPLSLISRLSSDISFDPSNTVCGQSVSSQYLSQKRRDRPMVAFWGTCQITPLMWALSHTKIASKYDIVQLGLNFLLANKSPAEIHKEIKNILTLVEPNDCIFMTPVYSNKYLNAKSLLKSFKGYNLNFLPYIVNTGYFPLYHTRSGWKGVHNFDRETLGSVIRGFYEFNLIRRFNDSINILKAREAESLGIKWNLSEYIQRESINSRLFYTYNHPSWKVIKYASERIANFLHIDIIGELDDECSYFEACFIEKDLHPWAQVDSCVTPYLMEHNWAWTSSKIDLKWKFKYANLIREFLSE